MLFGVQAHDPLVFATAAAVLTVTALAATALPAIRVSRIQPMAVLRRD